MSRAKRRIGPISGANADFLSDESDLGPSRAPQRGVEAERLRQVFPRRRGRGRAAVAVRPDGLAGLAVDPVDLDRVGIDLLDVLPGEVDGFEETRALVDHVPGPV